MAGLEPRGAILEGLRLPAAPPPRLVDSCRAWENFLAPWMLPAQQAHLRAFGGSAPALKAKLSRLGARLLALRQTGWKEPLARDASGRAIFPRSGATAAFAHAEGAAFCLSRGLRPGPLALDAEKAPLEDAAATRSFLERLYPSLAGAGPDPGPEWTIALWLAFECVHKIHSARGLGVDLAALLGRQARGFPPESVWLPELGLHMRFLKIGSWRLCAASGEPFPEQLFRGWRSLSESPAAEAQRRPLPHAHIPDHQPLP